MEPYRQALEAASGAPGFRRAELEEKSRRLLQWLDRSNLDAVLLRRHENLAWVSAGQIEARVGILSETGVPALLLLQDGRRFAVVPDNEAARLGEEELPDLGYEIIARPWPALDFAEEAHRLAPGRVASDTPLNGLVPADLRELRAPLLLPEIARLRRLAEQTAAIVSQALHALEPGMNEYAMEAMAAGPLLRAGIFPSVLLMAADDRILRYKHAVARGATLRRFGMLNLCTRRWGLAVSITRFVHFGAMPAELARGFETAQQVHAALQHATRTGATADSLFQVAAQAYAAAGFPGEEQLHHQGGACGYLEREWVARPGGREQVRPPQAFAWNPSSRGGKAEDTTLVTEGGVEVLTRTPGLPEVEHELGGSVYRSAGVLVRS